jgi:hypothetical protein
MCGTLRIQIFDSSNLKPKTTMANKEANFFIKTSKDFHARFFANNEDALNWIKGLQRKNDPFPIPNNTL